MKNKSEDLRNHLFATIEALQDEDKPMDLARARAVAETAQTLINLAKAELEFLKVTKQATGSDFFPQPSVPALGGPERKSVP